MNQHPFIPYLPKKYSEEEMLSRSENFFAEMNLRRSVREFSGESFDKKILENIIATASTAPSGAHKQPWTFCLVHNKALQREIRLKAEEEERRNYSGRMSQRWIEDLAPLGTDHQKEFLEIAPYLIVVFKRVYETDAEGTRHNNYYVNESVGIATGMLIAAIHQAGLTALTHTPSPMNFLEQVLERPKNERAYLLIPVGHASKEAKVPDIQRKALEEVMENYE